MNGTAETPGQPITLTLQPADGSPTSIYTITASYGAGAYNTCSSKAIQAGDQLTLTTPTGVVTFTVPNLTAQHDYARQALEGQALPNSAIVATFSAALFPYYTVTRRTQADGSGHYGMDTSDLGLLPGQSGTVTMTDEHGNTIQAGFTISGYRVYLPLALEGR